MISLRRMFTAAGAVGLALVMTGCIQSDTTENVVYNDPSAEPGIDLPDSPQIGRASCRERVSHGV